MKKVLIILTFVAAYLNIAAIFSDFNYVDSSQLQNWITTKKPLIIVDIQVPTDFAVHHIPGSIETNAYPVKSEEDRNKILPALAAYQKTNNDVVIICPRGKGGAKRCYTFLKENGVPDEKLFILTGGMEKWPYPELTASK